MSLWVSILSGCKYKGEKIMKDKLYMLIMYALIVGLFMGLLMLLKSGISYLDNYGNDDKKKAFNTGNSFRCYENTFDSKRRLVRKSDGWSIYKDTFKKDSLLLPIYKCEEETK